MSLLKSK